MTRMLTDLAEVLRDGGLPVREIPGWQTRGHGEMSDDVLGVLCHHTGGPASGDGDWDGITVPGYPSLEVVVDGRPGLEGPLANLGLTRDGTWLAISAGQGWHAGTGSVSWCPANAGNTHLIGVEAESTGRGDWTPQQLESYPRGVAALLRHLDHGPDRVLFHKTWAPERKIDVAGWPGDLPGFRADVARWLAVPGAGLARLDLEDDVLLEPAPTGRSVTLVVPAGATELVISLGWTSMRVDSVAFFGSTPAQGVNQRWRSAKAQVVDPARPWQIAVPPGAITAEVNYALAAHPGIEVFGVAAFRSAS